MTKRKLGGPASARNKQKKIREETSTQSSNENKDKQVEEVKEPTAFEPIKIKEEIEDEVVVKETNNTRDIIGKLLEDGEEEISGDENATASTSRDGEEGKTGAESLRQDLSRKTEELKKLKGQISSLTTQNEVLDFKYKKYKEMSKNFKKSEEENQDLKLKLKNYVENLKKIQEENCDLKVKLKNYVENLHEEQESKTDVGSKMALKDLMLQKEIKSVRFKVAYIK